MGTETSMRLTSAEQEQLHLWAHGDPGGTWEPVESTESHTEKYFSAPVINLSGYAVSY
jgi:hypothetical protein